MHDSLCPHIRRAARLLAAITGAALAPGTLSARTLFGTGGQTVWTYLDNGAQPDAAWTQVGFNDAAWKSGKAPLGYGRAGLGTEVGWGDDKTNKFITTWFRHTFQRPELTPGERLAINFCMDDGAAVYLNGRLIGQANMPGEPWTALTITPHAIGPSDEGFYLRMPLPARDLLPGPNVLAVEVHQCSPKSHDLFLDIEFKAVPPERPTPPVRASAIGTVVMFRQQDYIGPGIAIPDGYEDGGHAMTLDAEKRPVSGREILIVDRTNDVELAADLAFARSPELQALPPLERARRLAAFVDGRTTPPGGIRWVEPACVQMGKDYVNKPIFLGDWIDQCHAGVCRHRALLFKVLADEAGLKAALVRGHHAAPNRPPNEPHVWNELFIDGRRLLVDISLNRSDPNFPEVTNPDVAKVYRKRNNSALYEVAANE